MLGKSEGGEAGVGIGKGFSTWGSAAHHYLLSMVWVMGSVTHFNTHLVTLK